MSMNEKLISQAMNEFAGCLHKYVGALLFRNEHEQAKLRMEAHEMLDLFLDNQKTFMDSLHEAHDE